MVPRCIEYLPEYRGGYRKPPGVNGPSWAIVEERRRRPSGGALPPSPIQIGEEVRPPFLLSLFPFLPLLVGLGKGGTYS